MVIGMTTNIMLFFVLTLSSGLGIPMGVPPAEEDPIIINAAPEECIFYSSWAAMGQIDASANPTEAWMAQEELQRSFMKAKTELKKLAIDSVMDEDEAGQASVKLMLDFAEHTLTHAGVVYLSELVIAPDGDEFSAEGGMIIHLGENRAELEAQFERMMATVPDHQKEEMGETIIGGKTFNTIKSEPFTIVWGILDDYLYGATSESSMEQLLANVKTPSPEWLTEIRGRLSIDRISTVTYVNGKKIMPMFGQIPEPEFQMLLEKSGFKNLEAIGWVTGLNDTGFVSRTALDLKDGEATGIFKFVDGDPIKPTDIGRVDDDAMLMFAHRLSTEKIYDYIFEVADQVGERDNLESQISEFEAMTSVDLKSEIVDSVDDLVTLYGSLNLLNPTSGWVASVKIKNEMVFQGAFNKLTEFAEKLAEEEGLEFRKQERRGKTIYSLSMDGSMMMPFSLEPSWAVDGGELVFSLSRSGVSSHVRRDSSEMEKNIASQEPLKRVFEQMPEGSEGPIGVMQLDLAKIIELAVSSLRGFLPDDEPVPGTDLTVQDIPSAEVLINGVVPNVAGVYRTPKGFEFIQQQTLPGGSPGTLTGVGVAMLLPAVQQVRAAARRTDSANRVRQLALAMHNYAAAHGSFPPQYSTDEDGNPLLSWRVLILPYLEQQALYDEFNHDEPWDSEHNLALVERMPELYENPQVSAEEGKTSYLAASGEGALFNAPDEGEFGDESPSGVGFGGITDGTSNTIMLVEVNEDTTVVWSSPQDFDTTEDELFVMLRGVAPAGNNFAFADGSVHNISQFIDETVLKQLFTIAGGEDVDPFDW